MSQPPAYNKSQNYANYAAANPSAPFPAAATDSEFSAVETTLDAINTNLALMQRDDGLLKNGSVHPDSLSAATRVLISDWNPRGDWAAATVYALKDVVEEDGVWYVCIVAHTAVNFATDLAAARWMAINLDMGSLANTTDTAKGDALIGVKLDATGAVARTQHDRNEEVQLSVTDFGVSVSNTAAANSTALAFAIARATELSTNGGATLYFPPNASEYALEPLNLDTNAKRIFLVGDGPRASRIRISGGSTGAGTYGIQYSASDNSFGGLIDIGVTAVDAYEAVFHVNAPNNQFQFGRVYLDGNNACTYALKATGGTHLFLNWIYTTSVTSFNFYFLNSTAGSHFQIVGGNHDIGTDGIAFTSSTGSGGCLTLTGGRFETLTSKKLFKYTIVQETFLRINGSFFSGGAATAIVNTTTGASVQYHIDAAFNGTPSNLYTDDNSAANNIAITNDAQRSILENSKVFYCDVRVFGPTGIAAKARFKSGSQTEFSTFGGGDSNWYFRDETNAKNLWLANATVGLQMQTERHQCAQGADVASASVLVLGTDGNRFRVTGTTQIDRLSSVSWQGGAIVTLHFTDSVTVVHGNADSGTSRTINLAGAANFSATANDQLTLQYDETDTAWYEISRTVI